MTAGSDRYTGDRDAGFPRRPAPRVADRCPACGRLAFADGRCSACGHVEEEGSRSPRRTTSLPAERTVPAVRQGAANSPVEWFDTRPAQPIQPIRRTETAGPTSLSVPTPETLTPRRRVDGSGGSAPQVSGRILFVSPPQHEPMDFDPWRWVAIPAWGLLLLVAPVAFALVVWQMAGFLPALATAVVLLVILRYLFSNRLLDSWYLVSALNGRHAVEPMPVVMIRLRQWDEREIQLRLKGHFAGGGLMEGDRIQATGKWRGGVLRVREALCERTGARIAPRQPNSFRFAVTGTALLLLVCLWTLLAGLPWATGQLDRLPASLPDPPALPMFHKSTP